MAVPAHPAEAAGGEEVGAEEGRDVEVRRRRRVHERRRYLLLHGHPPGQARSLRKGKKKKSVAGEIIINLVRREREFQRNMAKIPLAHSAHRYRGIQYAQKRYMSHV